MRTASDDPAPSRLDRPVGLMFLAALLLTEQIASKAARDALFLLSFDPRRLPLVMIGGAAFSFIAVLTARRAHTYFSPRATLVGLSAISALLFAFEWGLSRWLPRHAAVVLYVHVSGLGALLVSSFWTMVSERWDPHRAKKHVAQLASSAALGGVVGGVIAQIVGALGDGRELLLFLAVSSALTAWVTHRVGASEGRSSHAAAAPAPSLRKVARWSYLWGLAGLTVLVAVWQALLDFGFKAIVDATIHDEGAMVRFFGAFYMCTSLATFLVQSLFGRMALARAGVSATAAATPLVVTLGGLAVMGVAFPFVILLRGAEMLLANSLLRSSYEVFFNPIPNGVVRASKTLVDVAATRVGDVAGSLLVLGLVMLEVGPAVPIVVAAGVALAALLVLPLVTRGYVHALTALLHRGMSVADGSLVDRTTQRALTAPAPPLSALAAIDEVVHHAATAATPPAAPIVAALESRSLPAVRRALRNVSDPALARVVLPLVAWDAARSEAMAALARLAPRATGALLDALLDPTTPPAVRAHIPKALRRATPERAATGLYAGLGDEQLEVRLQSARGLAHLKASGALEIDRDRILHAIEEEIVRHGEAWASIGPEPHEQEDDPDTLDAELHGAQLARSLRCALVLASMLTDPRQMELAVRGLGSPDPAVRGTAFELLSNLLPEPVRAPMLAGLDPARRISLVPKAEPEPAPIVVPRIATGVA